MSNGCVNCGAKPSSPSPADDRASRGCVTCGARHLTPGSKKNLGKCWRCIAIAGGGFLVSWTCYCLNLMIFQLKWIDSSLLGIALAFTALFVSHFVAYLLESE